jgi:hypothetical protein
MSGIVNQAFARFAGTWAEAPAILMMRQPHAFASHPIDVLIRNGQRSGGRRRAAHVPSATAILGTHGGRLRRDIRAASRAAAQGVAARQAGMGHDLRCDGAGGRMRTRIALDRVDRLRRQGRRKIHDGRRTRGRIHRVPADTGVRRRTRDRQPLKRRAAQPDVHTIGQAAASGPNAKVGQREAAAPRQDLDTHAPPGGEAGSGALPGRRTVRAVHRRDGRASQRRHPPADLGLQP